MLSFDPHAALHREIEVKVSTHAAGGLTQFDFVLAAKLDDIPVRVCVVMMGIGDKSAQNVKL